MKLLNFQDGKNGVDILTTWRVISSDYVSELYIFSCQILKIQDLASQILIFGTFKY